MTALYAYNLFQLLDVTPFRRNEKPGYFLYVLASRQVARVVADATKRAA